MSEGAEGYPRSGKWRGLETKHSLYSWYLLLVTPILLERCVFIHWKTGEFWHKKVLNHCDVTHRVNSHCISIVILEENGPIIPLADTTLSLFEHEEAFHEVREGFPPNSI